ncbi:MAG TPA: substrate-binding domain-containing protein [Polyangiaceae bacterium]|nr:substrate-binding domain-containing protein [Polyangiaceae bacterium]
MMIKQRTLTAATLIGALASGACSSEDEPASKTIKIGYSSPGDENNWFNSYNTTLQQATDSESWELTTLHAGRVNARAPKGASPEELKAAAVSQQLEDVDTLVAKGLDAIVFGPIGATDEEKALEAIGIANAAKIPVFVVNRDPEWPVPATSDQYVTRIHSDFDDFGYKMCGEYAREALPDGDIGILMVYGTIGASNTIGYEEGCKRAVAEDTSGTRAILDQTDLPNLNGKGGIHGNFSPGVVRELLLGADPGEAIPTPLLTDIAAEIVAGNINLIVSMSDMSLAMIEALELPSADPGDGTLWHPDGPNLEAGVDFMIISGDADPGQARMIEAGKIFGVMSTSPYYGDITVSVIKDYLAGDPIDTFYPVADKFINARNLDDDDGFPFCDPTC